MKKLAIYITLFIISLLIIIFGSIYLYSYVFVKHNTDFDNPLFITVGILLPVSLISMPKLYRKSKYIYKMNKLKNKNNV
ncbi:hypothetical protein [Acholeplasma hippikon]|uniref:Uncharacterized protein n=1 Tax=Acholeplasma hippikon TaxID=264636 RepID=A0A449BL47_9MOLU|nr:hypothetical protein [Acholeplasma hippikon]VEU83113.1 Uncharacterised protein [Acholeplasma hippikon]